ncbi:MAG: hypothetical protein JNM59_12645 [Hyphomonadaceae bacterium]|nr:hypothetical protein [Hyphomonadaceae bacterium]
MLSKDHRESAPAQRCRSAWPLAERYEAILRAFNDPVAAARRLAARLFARPREGARVLSEPPDACHRIDRHEELQAAAHEAARVFNSG